MGETSQAKETLKRSGFLPTMYYDIISNLLIWLGMTIHVNRPEATDNMQLIDHI